MAAHCTPDGKFYLARLCANEKAQRIEMASTHRARRRAQGPCRLCGCHARMMSHDTPGATDCPSVRRGRFINSALRRGLATADESPDHSDGPSLDRRPKRDKNNSSNSYG